MTAIEIVLFASPVIASAICWMVISLKRFRNLNFLVVIIIGIILAIALAIGVFFISQWLAALDYGRARNNIRDNFTASMGYAMMSMICSVLTVFVTAIYRLVKRKRQVV